MISGSGADCGRSSSPLPASLPAGVLRYRRTAPRPPVIFVVPLRGPGPGSSARGGAQYTPAPTVPPSDRSPPLHGCEPGPVQTAVLQVVGRRLDRRMLWSRRPEHGSRCWSATVQRPLWGRTWSSRNSSSRRRFSGVESPIETAPRPVRILCPCGLDHRHRHVHVTALPPHPVR